MRPIVKLAGVGALAGASLLAVAVSADATTRTGAVRPHAAAVHGGYGGYRHMGAYGGYRHVGAYGSFERRYSHNLAGYLAAGAVGVAAANAATGYPAGYEGAAPPVEPGYGESYGAPVGAEGAPLYSHEDAEHVVLYHSVTRDYTVPVHSYRTEQRTHYEPVTTYRAVTTEYQVPVTSYETVQRTEEVPTVYRVVHHGCGCGFGY